MQKDQCARYGAALLPGAPLTDYTFSTYGGTIHCAGLIRTASLKPPEKAPRAVKPWPVAS
jgi:hypothetical protein